MGPVAQLGPTVEVMGARVDVMGPVVQVGPTEVIGSVMEVMGSVVQLGPTVEVIGPVVQVVPAVEEVGPAAEVGPECRGAAEQVRGPVCEVSLWVSSPGVVTGLMGHVVSGDTEGRNSTRLPVSENEESVIGVSGDWPRVTLLLSDSSPSSSSSIM